MNKVAKITNEQAKKALNVIREFEGVDPMYISQTLAAAYELLDIYLEQVSEEEVKNV